VCICDHSYKLQATSRCLDLEQVQVCALFHATTIQ